MKRIEVNKSIYYLNYSKNIKELFSDIHCIVLPSYREGMSNILMQSLAMGRPIITTNEPGCRELVIDKSNGFIINSRSVKDLFLAMKTFINLDLEEKIIMSKKSQEHSINFDIKNVVSLYNNLLSKI